MATIAARSCRRSGKGRRRAIRSKTEETKMTTTNASHPLSPNEALKSLLLSLRMVASGDFSDEQKWEYAEDMKR
jgi:hypothetical protein